MRMRVGSLPHLELPEQQPQRAQVRDDEALDGGDVEEEGRVGHLLQAKAGGDVERPRGMTWWTSKRVVSVT